METADPEMYALKGGNNERMTMKKLAGVDEVEPKAWRFLVSRRHSTTTDTTTSYNNNDIPIAPTEHGKHWTAIYPQHLTNTSQPPKRKQPPKPSAPSKPTAPPKRRSKLAKEHSLTASEELEIHEAFSLFSTPSDTATNTIAASEIRRCLVALNAPPKNQAEMNEMLDAVDPDNSGWVSYEHFVAIAALKLRSRHEEDGEEVGERAEVERAFRLFTRGEEREITLSDLRRVARELREEVPDNVLKDMVREATGGGLGGVGMEDFDGVMRRAGVFG